MKPKEKAEELYEKIDSKYSFFVEYNISESTKEIANLLADELIKHLPSVCGMPPNCQQIDEYCSEYWKQVKLEIEKL